MFRPAASITDCGLCSGSNTGNDVRVKCCYAPDGEHCDTFGYDTADVCLVEGPEWGYVFSLV